MRRVVSFILIYIISVSLSGCLSAGRRASGGYSEPFEKLLSPNNNFASINTKDIEGLPKDMTYVDIIRHLGKTRDIGSGLHVAKYVVDDNKELLLSFGDPEDINPLSGKDMIKKLRERSDNNGLNPQAANACIVSNRYKSAPIYDGVNNEIVGEVYGGFAIYIEGQRDGKAYFSTPIVDVFDLDKVTIREFYIPINYLEKGYVEPAMVIDIISLDAILVNAKTPIYDGKDNKIAVFNEKFGPVRYIQKTEKGYQLTLGLNLIYIRDTDVEVKKYKN